MKYFFYEMSMTGKFKPVKSVRKPAKAPAGSHTPQRLKIIELPFEQQHLTIEELCSRYPLT